MARRSISVLKNLISIKQCETVSLGGVWGLDAVDGKDYIPQDFNMSQGEGMDTQIKQQLPLLRGSGLQNCRSASFKRESLLCAEICWTYLANVATKFFF